MSNSKISLFFNSIQNAIVKHCPEILTGLGIAGMTSTIVLAVGATPKAMKLIEEKKKEEKVEKLTPIETIKTTWKCYVPSVVTWGLSVGCLIGSSSVHSRRNAALAAAYSLSETALRDYKEKAVEVVGEKKEQLIQDAVAKKKIDEDPISSNTTVIVTGNGETECYDTITGRYFLSDIEKIRKIVNELNRRMRDEMYISLNEFYYEMGLPETKIGDMLGWNIDSGYIDISFSAQLDKNDKPCLVINYDNLPKQDYRNIL